MRLFSLAPTSSGALWYESYRTSADTYGIIGIHEYTIRSPLSRGKASELIIRIRDYARTKVVQADLSKGCTSGKSLGTTNTLTIGSRTRSYILSVPRNYTASKHYSLIVASHGRTNSNAMVQ